jgi:hypothetical protein
LTELLWFNRHQVLQDKVELAEFKQYLLGVLFELFMEFGNVDEVFAHLLNIGS